jgi:hypothetical protein
MMMKAEFRTGNAGRVYKRTAENKRYIWQEKVAQDINKLITQKEVKKVREAIRNITRRKEPLISVEPHQWVSHFQELFL